MSTCRLLLLSEKCVCPGIEKAGRMEWGGMEEEGPLSLCFYALCTLMLGSVSKVLLEAGKRKRLEEKPVYACMCLTVHMDRLYLEALQVFIHGSIWPMTAILFILLFLPCPLILCLLYNHHLFPTYFSRSQSPPLAGLNPVGCNPRGAPDTVNSPFTCAAELLQTFLLIFTGLKASPFSLIIP